jgi:uncharacterized protein YhfF
MSIPSAVAAFWTEFSRRAGGVDDSLFYEAFHFGDSEALAQELADLVLAGSKRATAGALWSFEAAGKRLPRPGDLSVVTAWDGRPLCVIRTTRVELMPFDAVSAEFAAAEGEGDGSLAFWRRVHTAYFGRECARIGRLFAKDMPVCCERFELVHAPAPGSR